MTAGALAQIAGTAGGGGVVSDVFPAPTQPNNALRPADITSYAEKKLSFIQSNSGSTTVTSQINGAILSEAYGYGIVAAVMSSLVPTQPASPSAITPTTIAAQASFTNIVNAIKLYIGTGTMGVIFDPGFHNPPAWLYGLANGTFLDPGGNVLPNWAGLGFPNTPDQMGSADVQAWNAAYITALMGALANATFTMPDGVTSTNCLKVLTAIQFGGCWNDEMHMPLWSSGGVGYLGAGTGSPVSPTTSTDFVVSLPTFNKVASPGATWNVYPAGGMVDFFASGIARSHCFYTSATVSGSTVTLHGCQPQTVTDAGISLLGSSLGHLTTGITNGATVTTLAVSALSAGIPAGVVALFDTSTNDYQEFVLPTAVPAGATSITVTSATAATAFAITTTQVSIGFQTQFWAQYDQSDWLQNGGAHLAVGQVSATSFGLPANYTYGIGGAFETTYENWKASLVNRYAVWGVSTIRAAGLKYGYGAIPIYLLYGGSGVRPSNGAQAVPIRRQEVLQTDFFDTIMAQFGNKTTPSYAWGDVRVDATWIDQVSGSALTWPANAPAWWWLNQLAIDNGCTQLMMGELTGTASTESTLTTLFLGGNGASLSANYSLIKAVGAALNDVGGNLVDLNPPLGFFMLGLIQQVNQFAGAAGVAAGAAGVLNAQDGSVYGAGLTEQNPVTLDVPLLGWTFAAEDAQGNIAAALGSLFLVECIVAQGGTIGHVSHGLLATGSVLTANSCGVFVFDSGQLSGTPGTFTLLGHASTDSTATDFATVWDTSANNDTWPKSAALTADSGSLVVAAGQKIYLGILAGAGTTGPTLMRKASSFNGNRGRFGTNPRAIVFTGFASVAAVVSAGTVVTTSGNEKTCQLFYLDATVT